MRDLVSGFGSFAFVRGYKRNINFGQVSKNAVGAEGVIPTLCMSIGQARRDRSPWPICCIARLSCALANTKVWGSKPSACLRSSNAKMTLAKILGKVVWGWFWQHLELFFSNRTLLGKNKGNTFWALANALQWHQELPIRISTPDKISKRLILASFLTLSNA